MPKLTKTLVDSLPLPDAGQQFVWDTELKGFGLRLTPSVKSYIVQSRVNGRNKRVTVGKHGPFTVHQARERAKDLLRDMAHGINPHDEKKRKIAETVTLQQVRDGYVKDRNLKPRSVSDIDTHLDRSFKDWRNKPIINITRNMVLARFRELSTKSKAQANQAFRILRGLLNYARAAYRPDDKPILPENPVQILSDAKVWHYIKPKTRRIPFDKMGHAWNAIQSMRLDPAKTDVGKTLADAIAFTILTGARREEVFSLTWDRVDLKKNTWHIPDPKNSNPVTLPLSRQAKAIIENRPHLNRFVFANEETKTGHVHEPKRLMSKISDECGAIVSVHDMRRTFRAVAAECGIELWKTKLLMNHKLNEDVTISAYTETSDLAYLLPEIQKIADWIEMQGETACPSKAEVRPQA